VLQELPKFVGFYFVTYIDKGARPQRFSLINCHRVLQTP